MNRTRLSLAIALVSTLTACHSGGGTTSVPPSSHAGGELIGYEVIYNDEIHNIPSDPEMEKNHPESVVISDYETYDRYSQEFAQRIVQPVDFATQRLVYVGLGWQGNAGSRFIVKNVKDMGEKVSVQLQPAQTGCIGMTVMSYPSILLTVNTTKPVTVEILEENSDCDAYKDYSFDSPKTGYVFEQSVSDASSSTKAVNTTYYDHDSFNQAYTQYTNKEKTLKFSDRTKVQHVSLGAKPNSGYILTLKEQKSTEVNGVKNTKIILNEITAGENCAVTTSLTNPTVFIALETDTVETEINTVTLSCPSFSLYKKYALQ